MRHWQQEPQSVTEQQKSTLRPELAERSSLRYVRVEIEQVVKIFDRVAKTTDAEVFIGEWCQVEYLPFTCWYQHVTLIHVFRCTPVHVSQYVHQSGTLDDTYTYK